MLTGNNFYDEVINNMKSNMITFKADDTTLIILNELVKVSHLSRSDVLRLLIKNVSEHKDTVLVRV